MFERTVSYKVICFVSRHIFLLYVPRKYYFVRGSVAQWVARLTRNRWMHVRASSKAPIVSLSENLYSHCLVLVGSRNEFERDLHK